MAAAAPARALGPGLLTLLIVTMCVSAASMHFQTPMLETIRREFDVDATAVGGIATATQAGYVIGLVLLVPLGDRWDKRTLILGKLAALIASCMVVATAASVAVVIAASFAIGVLATASQDVIPLGADLGPPAERGRIMGTLLSGLMLGILCGRLFGGVITSALGWRAAYWIAAGLLAILLPLIARMVPAAPGRAQISYGELLRSIAALMRKHPGLRHSSFVQMLLGIGYGAFWATLALMLAAFHDLGSTAAGLIGLPGAAGILIARPVGRFVDRRGSGPVVMAGCLLVLAGFVVFSAAALSVGFVILGVMLMDFGMRASQVANQSFVNGLDPAARSRTNMIFMAHQFTGYSIGGATGGYAWSHGGWIVVAGLGFCMAALALVLHGFVFRSEAS